MKILKNELKNELNIRTEKNFPQEGIEFIDIMPLIIQKETFNEIIDKMSTEISNKKVDYIVGPEARGLFIGSAIAYKLNVYSLLEVNEESGRVKLYYFVLLHTSTKDYKYFFNFSTLFS